MKKSVFLTVVLAFLLISCGNDKDANPSSKRSEKKIEPGVTQIMGQISNASEKMIYFSLYESKVVTDTVLTDADGNFSFEVPVARTDYYKFYFDQKNMIVLILDENTKEVTVTGDANNFTYSYNVEGSKNSELMRQFFMSQKKFNTQKDSMMSIIRTADPEKRKVAQTDYSKFVKGYNNRMKKWALENPSSPAALSMISNLNPKDYMDVYDKVFAQLDKVIPHSKPYVDLKKELNMYKQKSQKKKEVSSMMNGAAPEIEMNNPDGKTLKLSSLKGKYVLIDFWASWCAPCRRENPNVVKMYEKYKDKGFEIFGVSLDKDRKRWEAAIEADGLTWPQVSDLAGWESAAAKKYGVTSIPHTVLLDKEGNIIATKLRGPSLEKKLAELLGN